MKWIERTFESILWHSRLMVVLAVIASIVAAFVMVLIGVANVALTVTGGVDVLLGKAAFDAYQVKALSAIIAAVDVFLISTVLLIFGVGLYELFISRIDQIDSDTKSARVLQVSSLDDLKDRLAKVIIMVLVVAFFKQALGVEIEDVQQILYFSGGILMASLSLLALFYYKRTHEPGSDPDDKGSGTK